MPSEDGYKREKTWGDLYKRFDEEKTGEEAPDFRSFAELFKERGLKGYNRQEKESAYDEKELARAAKHRYPENPQRSLDLHNFTVEEGRLVLGKFIRESREMGFMFVVVIPGKGLNSPEGKSKLRPMVTQELNKMVANRQVRDFKSAEPRHGGFGAYYVYLK